MNLCLSVHSVENNLACPNDKMKRNCFDAFLLFLSINRRWPGIILLVYFVRAHTVYLECGGN